MAQVGASDPGRGRGVAHPMVAIDAESLAGATYSFNAMRRFVDAVRRSRPTVEGEPVLIPGDPQRQHRERQGKHGLELDSATIALLDRLAMDP
jgi:ureidoglycolate dehydrogenase (NAD+)